MVIDGLALICGAPAERLGMGAPAGLAPQGNQPHGPPSAPVEIRRLNQVPVLYLNRHGGDYAIAPHRINYRANLLALAAAGAKGIVGVHSVGGIAAEAVPGTLVIPHDLIDYTHSRDAGFAKDGAGKGAFVEFANPFDAELRAGLAAAASGMGCLVRGIYGVTQGPRPETAAEIDRLERDGCTLVGMTLMPEAVLARELAIPYVSLSIVSNYAAGRNRSGETASILEQHAVWLDKGLERARELLVRWLTGADDSGTGAR